MGQLGADNHPTGTRATANIRPPATGRSTQESGLHNADAPHVEASVGARRDAALRDLPFAFENGDHVLITYASPEGDDAKHGIVSGADPSS